MNFRILDNEEVRNRMLPMETYKIGGRVFEITDRHARDEISIAQEELDIAKQNIEDLITRTTGAEEDITKLKLSSITPDTSLGIEGAAADSKAVGDAINSLTNQLENQNIELTNKITALDDIAVKSLNGILPDENGEISYTPPVTSINGYTGDAKLTATDVEAVPISGGTMTGVLDAPSIKENNVALENKYAQVFKYTVVLTSSGWSDSAPYTQTGTVTGLKSTDNVISDIDMSNVVSADNGANKLEAWSFIGRIEIQDGSITAYCYEDVPEVDLRVKLLVVGSVVNE